MGFKSPPIVSPASSYGVHTSLEITPNAWFRRLALGCAIALEACHCEEERRSNHKNYRMMRLLRSARNDG
ncbi:hypothetical protein ACN23B_21625 [Anabaena sp. FACHB-709]|uniref:Uncharacterized protein n=1 Tax=Anabaena cylindrica FACHB-318 TaxID=2692880 RepID=A0ABR7ZLQ7_ANACY|nr:MULTISPECIES: hypothetical protein [Nostocaceae]MBD2173622.1 hypothetical protein [Anabaena cylindrica FACHB-318]MBD2265299.1 hypothetical protein [Anabaena sp. FACHB-709]MBD2275291.1 hypothetical protein [Nostoc sp. PCC 7120 = FACHB-418]MBD2285724.1 hypothetical protein [Anabaena cylindrica FACHB-170]MBD2350990.1 hypothetical protein [Trichormus variabilis FACHB-171]